MIKSHDLSDEPIISVDDKQLIQSYLDTYVAELEDFQKGQLEPMF